jgi:hypothetical protein
MFGANKKAYRQKGDLYYPNFDFHFFERGNDLYVMFQTDNNIDKGKGDVRLFHLINFYSESATIEGVRFYVQSTDENNQCYDLIIEKTETSKSKVLHSIILTQDFVEKFDSKFNISTLLQEKFFSRLKEFIENGGRVENSSPYAHFSKDTVSVENENVFLSNKKFITTVAIVIALFFLFIHFTGKNDSIADSEPTGSYDLESNQYGFQNQQVSPALVTGTVQTVSKAASSQNYNTSANNLADYLNDNLSNALNEKIKSAPSSSDVNKVINTPFEDANSVNQQVELNKQVLDRLNLPKPADTDTGCFTG